MLRMLPYNSQNRRGRNKGEEKPGRRKTGGGTRRPRPETDRGARRGKGKRRKKTTKKGRRKRKRKRTKQETREEREKDRESRKQRRTPENKTKAKGNKFTHLQHTSVTQAELLEDHSNRTYQRCSLE